MNRKSNPFIDWLGLDSVAPNHFQLLGIDPSVTDRRSIKKAAGATLERLGDRPTNGKDLENWRLVRRQIKVAYQCLELCMAIWVSGDFKMPLKNKKKVYFLPPEFWGSFSGQSRARWPALLQMKQTFCFLFLFILS